MYSTECEEIAHDLLQHQHVEKQREHDIVVSACIGGTCSVYIISCDVYKM